jgi:hypothetical protein
MLTIISADPSVWPNLAQPRTCDYVWNFSEIQYTVVPLTVPFSLVLSLGFGHHGKHGATVCRQDTPVMGQSPARVTFAVLCEENHLC